MTTLARMLTVVCLAIAVSAARAEDTYCRVPISRLSITEGALPTIADGGIRRWDRAQSFYPSIVLDGPGEAYVALPDATSGLDSSWPYQWQATSASLAARVPGAAAVSGSLFVPNAEWTALVRVKFTFTPDKSDADARQSFQRAKAIYYERLQLAGTPGTAFFRHQADMAWRELPPRPDDAEQRRLARARAGRELSDTYDLFSGGAAVAENLQLNRELPAQRPGAEPEPADTMVPLESIEGITVASIDWSVKLAGAAPALDPRGAAIPADQHAVFFPSFAALMTVMDEAAKSGLPAFRATQARSEDGLLAERYEKQLCLSRSALSRLLGPSVIKSVAVTGSDPYFPTGTDVAVLFQPADAASLRTLILAQVRLRAQGAGAKPVSGEVGGVKYEGAATEDRAVCSYVATIGGAVVVANSTAQLKRLGEVASGAAAALASLPEYRFFRSRYAIGDSGETALVFLSDATIRRWCGARWRIAASRRLRAAAVMADVTAAHVDELVAGVKGPGPVSADIPMRTIGTLTLGPSGVASSVYGHADFLTPIAELDLTEVPTDEADAYKRWRDTYQRNWSWAFDPVALRLSVEKGRLGADLTVMPLILSSEYRLWMSIAQGATLSPGAGDPHDALAHGVIAINPESPAVKQASGFGRMMAPGVEIDPLAWLGGALAVYADPDPFWAEMLAAPDESKFFEAQVHRLPVGLYVEVGSALKLTAFLTAVRSFVEQSSPGMTAWETRTYHDQPYVRVGMSEKAAAQRGDNAFDKIAVCYAATPRALIVSLNEAVLKRAIDRQTARTAPGATPEQAGWVGSSVALRFTHDGLSLVQGPGRATYRTAMQNRAWSNIPILNEWKRRFPDQDPVKVHERLWGTRLVCPGGGTYLWDAEFQTMASTAYGHPGAPKPGPDGMGPLGTIRSGNLGLTFEGDGLRARVVLERAPE